MVETRNEYVARGALLAETLPSLPDLDHTSVGKHELKILLLYLRIKAIFLFGK